MASNWRRILETVAGRRCCVQGVQAVAAGVSTSKIGLVGMSAGFSSALMTRRTAWMDSSPKRGLKSRAAGATVVMSTTVGGAGSDAATVATRVGGGDVSKSSAVSMLMAETAPTGRGMGHRGRDSELKLSTASTGVPFALPQWLAELCQLDTP